MTHIDDKFYDVDNISTRVTNHFHLDVSVFREDFISPMRMPTTYSEELGEYLDLLTRGFVWTRLNGSALNQLAYDEASQTVNINATGNQFDLEIWLKDIPVT